VLVAIHQGDKCDDDGNDEGKGNPELGNGDEIYSLEGVFVQRTLGKRSLHAVQF
jgi:hypothetical protein